MSLIKKFLKLLKLKKYAQYERRLGLNLLNNVPNILRGFDYARQWNADGCWQCDAPFSHGYKEVRDVSPNPLEIYFNSHKTGRGIYKWTHYFDIYDRHFRKFLGSDVHVLEIGVYAGGSLEMWRNYFGSRSYIYGVDNQKECKCFENEYTKIFIGDQADRTFWKSFKKNVPTLDILIDDGGHQTEQQIATFEEMLPHIRPGGVYVCEDIHGKNNGFSAYMHGIVNNLNTHKPNKSNTALIPTGFQALISSAHFYPFVTVIEKNYNPVDHFIALKNGSEWQPFL